MIKTFLPVDPEKNGHPAAPGDRVLIQGREERSSLSAIVLAGIGEGTVNLLGGGRENSFRASQGQIAAEMARAIDRAGRHL